MDDELQNITLAVIAGGLGTRMGQPKAFLKVGEQPILSWMLNRLRWRGPTMLVTAPAVLTPPGAQQFDDHFVDPVDGLGPMRGVLTALEHLNTPIVIALAVDMPLIEQMHLRWFAKMLPAKPEISGLMGSNGLQIEPFPAAYRASAANLIRTNLISGQRSLHRLCTNPQFLAQPVPSDWGRQAWLNLNDPAQLGAFESSLVL